MNGPDNKENKNPHSRTQYNGVNMTTQQKEVQKQQVKKGQGRAIAIVGGGYCILLAVLYSLRFTGILPQFTLLHPAALALIPLFPTLVSILISGAKPVSAVVLLTSLYLAAACLNASLWKLLIPFVLLTVGLAILFSGKAMKHRKMIDAETGQAYMIPRYVAVMNSRVEAPDDTAPLCGLAVCALFGKIRLYLRALKFEDAAVIDVVCLFSSVELRLPENVNVHVRRRAFPGSLLNHTLARAELPNLPTVTPEVASLCGRVELY